MMDTSVQEKQEHTQDESEQFTELMNLFSSVDVNLADLEKFDDSVLDGIYSFAYGYYEKGWYQDAESLFRLLTGLRLRSPQYWKGLGATLQMQKKYDEAIEAYSWAAITDDNVSDPYPHFHAAECFLTKGEVKRGLKALYSAKTIAKKQGTYYALLQQIELLQATWRNKG